MRTCEAGSRPGDTESGNLERLIVGLLRETEDIVMIGRVEIKQRAKSKEEDCFTFQTAWLNR